jgi:hypothetical protein
MSRPDNIDIRDNVIAALLDEKRAAPVEQKLTNYEAIQKLTANFMTYIQAEGIHIPAPLLAQLNRTDASGKIAFVKAHLAQHVNGIEELLQQASKAEGVELTAERLSKCARFLRAMIEVAQA